VTGQEISNAVKGGVRQWRGGLFSPNDGRAEPFIAVPAMARALQNRGGMVFTHCAARGIEKAAGKVHSLVTEKGTIRTDTVVVAGGYWTRRFLANLNIRFPQIGVVNSVMRTAARDTGIDHTISGGIYTARKRLDGGFTVTHNEISVAEITPSHLSQFLPFLPLMRVGAKDVKMRLGKRFFEESRLAKHWALDQASPFEAVRILDPKPYENVLARAFDALKKDYPAFQGMEIAESWAGMIDATPDAVPVIDRIKQIPGLFVASGFSGHGFGLGPGAAHLMANIITGETPCVDPKPFRHGRFGRFATAKPTTGL
jgi:glycine/D-amino acid oxidase-like deaminating enzyme